MRVTTLAEENNEGRLEKTIQMLATKFNYFDTNDRQFLSPISKLLFTTMAFCKCFDNTDSEYKELETIYKDPIAYTLKQHPTAFSGKSKYKMTVQKTLGQIEWIFYRDSHRYTKLKQQYFSDSNKPRESKSITFDDISAIRGYVEMDVQRLMIKIIKKNNVDVSQIVFPTADDKILDDLGVGFS